MGKAFSFSSSSWRVRRKRLQKIDWLQEEKERKKRKERVWYKLILLPFHHHHHHHHLHSLLSSHYILILFIISHLQATVQCSADERGFGSVALNLSCFCCCCCCKCELRPQSIGHRWQTQTSHLWLHPLPSQYPRGPFLFFFFFNYLSWIANTEQWWILRM